VSNDTEYDSKLRASPLGYSTPCKGCAHLRPRGEDFFCAYIVPPEVAGWLKLNAFGLRRALTETADVGRWITAKEVNGPFADDANPYVCSARSPADA
jgi:hypothetical protein